MFVRATRSVAATLIATWITVLALSAASADVIYTYVGNDFTSFCPSSSCGPSPGQLTFDRISISLTLPSPLTANLNNFSVTPISFTIADGGPGISNSIALITQSFKFSTNASDQITDWQVSVMTLGLPHHVGSAPSLDLVAIFGDFAFNTNTPGTWFLNGTAVSVPFPSVGAGLPGLLAAVVALLALCDRRVRKSPPLVP